MSFFIEEMIDAARFFHQRGWLMGTCGNLSIKQSEGILVTPSGKDKGRLQPEDLLLVDETGRSLNGVGKASEEFSVHQEIYARTDAGAVYHVHSIPNNLASHLWQSQGHVRLQGIEMIKGLAGKTLLDRVKLPIVSNSQDMPELAANVAAGVRADVPAVLVHQHGIYVWGKDPQAARRHVEIFEFLLEYVVKVATLPGTSVAGELMTQRRKLSPGRTKPFSRWSIW